MIYHQIGVIPADSSGVSLFWAVIGGIGSGAFWLLKQLNDQEEKVDDLDDLVQAKIDMGQEQIEEALMSLAAINESCEFTVPKFSFGARARVTSYTQQRKSAHETPFFPLFPQ